MKMQIACEDVTTAETLDEMESILDAIHHGCDSSRPVVATIEYPNDCRVDIGLGDAESIVIIWPQWRSDEADTYHVSLADGSVDGTKWYWLHGTADTEFERKHLIPVDLARRVVREFVQTGRLSDTIKWITEHYCEDYSPSKWRFCVRVNSGSVMQDGKQGRREENSPRRARRTRRTEGVRGVRLALAAGPATWQAI